MIIEHARIIEEAIDIIKRTYRDKKFPPYPLFKSFGYPQPINMFWNRYLQKMFDTPKKSLICSSTYTPIEVIIELMAGYYYIPLELIHSGKLTSQELYQLIRSAEYLKIHPFWLSCSEIVDDTIINEIGIEIVIRIRRESLYVNLVEQVGEE